MNSHKFCFFNDDRICEGCASFKDDQCVVLSVGLGYLANQNKQTELLEGLLEVQQDVKPLVKEVLPMMTKMMAIASEAMPLIEKMAKDSLEELREDLSLDDDDSEDDEPKH
jgi:hypothetical protein